LQNLKEIVKITKKLKLLYVEDNENARLSTLGILEQFFDRIVVGVDGVDGLEKFKEGDIDLIITDINMPKLDGLEMLKEVKKIDPTVVSLIFSAYTESTYFIESIKIGIEGYLIKPINFEQFIGVITKAVENIEAAKNKLFLDQYKDIADQSSILSIIDTNDVLTYVNSAYCEISEYAKEELIGSDYHKMMLLEQDRKIRDEINKTLKIDKKVWKGIIKNITKTGKAYYLDSTIKPILDERDNILEYIALRHDVTAIMSPMKRLEDLIDSALNPIVVLIRIENFDDIENFYPEKVLHEIEEVFSNKLLKLMPEELSFKSIFRLNHGEYAFAKDKKNCHLDDKELEKSLKLFQANVEEAHMSIGDLDYDVSILISISYGEEVLENARYGLQNLIVTKHNYILANNFAQNEHKEAEQNLKVLKMVKTAIINRKIISYFQPIVENATQKIVKYESLVRLVDEEDNVISPFVFLNIAKKGKYYNQITSMVLDNSFAALLKTDVDISMNISALDIEKSVTKEKILSLLEEHKEHAHRVVLELLEDEEVKDFDLIKEFIVKVKSMGVRIAIDDFGSGYSSFERLLEYQPDILKLDGSLIKDILTNKFSLSIVKTMVGFAKEQNIQVIAEYVENEAIFNLLKSLGVDYSQGYYFGKPCEL